VIASVKTNARRVGWLAVGAVNRRFVFLLLFPLHCIQNLHMSILRAASAFEFDFLGVRLMIEIWVMFEFTGCAGAGVGVGVGVGASNTRAPSWGLQFDGNTHATLAAYSNFPSSSAVSLSLSVRVDPSSMSADGAGVDGGSSGLPTLVTVFGHDLATQTFSLRDPTNLQIQFLQVNH
jgi:hypothetical protein